MNSQSKIDEGIEEPGTEKMSIVDGIPDATEEGGTSTQTEDRKIPSLPISFDVL